MKATAREPNDKELALLVKLYQESLSAYTEDTAAANALVTTGGHTPPPTDEIPVLAATIQIARAILNLHEVITRS